MNGIFWLCSLRKKYVRFSRSSRSSEWSREFLRFCTSTRRESWNRLGVPLCGRLRIVLTQRCFLRKISIRREKRRLSGSRISWMRNLSLLSCWGRRIIISFCLICCCIKRTISLIVRFLCWMLIILSRWILWMGWRIFNWLKIKKSSNLWERSSTKTRS